MSCCNEWITVTCADYCQDIELPYMIQQDGVHTFITYLVNNTVQKFEVAALIGDPVTIPANSLNEAKDNLLQLIQPDGMPYEFAPGIECIRVQTYVAVDTTPLP